MRNSQKLVSIFLYFILAVSVVLLGVFFYKMSGVEATLKDDGWVAVAKEMGSALDLIIGWAYVLIGLGAAAAIVPSVYRMFTRPKEAIKSGISIAVIVILVLIAYSLADDTLLKLPGGQTVADNVPDKLVFADTLLFTMYFLLAGAVISIIYAEVAKIFK